MKRITTLLALACLLAACGAPEEGPPLGAFPALSKKDVDASFTLVAPSSRSPAPFVFTSSNPAVATVDGAVVTITGPGETTISASQPRAGSFGPTRTAATLTVTATCVSPAVVANHACTAPVSDATAATVHGLIFARVLHTDTWAHARDFCAGTVIDSVGNWRLPSQAELADLATSGAIAGHQWTLGSAWSSTAAGSMNNGHMTVDLASGAKADRADTDKAYVSCVR
jgi:hypothetical protein